jgi:Tripartite tricarboxylate transporter TctB family
VAALVRSPKDFWTGMIYVAVGVAGFVISRDYSFGTAGRMGPGYFPNVIAGLLVLFGAIALVRSLLQAGEPIGSIPWKALILILAGVVSFGFLLPTLGLVVAMVVLVLLSAAASAKFRFEWGAVAGLVALVVFCSIVFVKGLGVPMPLVGTWLEPVLPAWLGG